MATRDVELKFILSSEDGQLKASVRSVSGDLRQLGAEGSRAGAALGSGFTAARAGVTSISTQLLAARNALVGFLSVGGLSQLGRQINDLANAYDNANLKLRFYTRSNEEFAAAQSGVFAIAQSTRTSLQQTAELYGRVQDSVRNLNGTQQQALALTQAINQAAALDGGNGDGGAAAERINKVFADGKIEAREFKTVLSEFPGLGKAVVDGLGVPLDEVVQRAAAGKLSLADFYNAVLSQKDQIAAAYAQLPVQVEQVMVRLTNALASYVGKSPQVQAASATISSAVNAIAENVAVVADTVVAVGSVLVAVLATRVVQALGASSAAFLNQAVAARAAVAAAQQAAAAEVEVALARTYSTSAQVAGLAAEQAALAARIRQTASLIASAEAEYANGLAVARGTAAQAEKVLALQNAKRVEIELAALKPQLIALERQHATASAALADAKIAETAAVQRLTAATAVQNAGMLAQIKTLYAAKGAIGVLGAALNGLLQIGLAFYAGFQIGTWLYEQSGFVRQFGNLIAQTVLEIGELAKLAGDILASPFTAGTVDEAVKDYARRVKALRDDMAAARTEAGKDLPAGPLPGLGGDAPATLTGDPTAAANQAQRQALEQSVSLAKRASDRRRAVLAAELEDGKIQLAAYYAERQRLDERDLDSTIAARRAERALTQDLDEKKRLNAEIKDLLAERATIGPRTAREQAKAERELADSLEQVRIGLLAATGQDLQARLDTIANKWKKIREEATKKGGDGRLAVYDQAEAAEKAAERALAIQRQVEAAQARFASKRSSAQADAAGGLVPTLGVRGRIESASAELRASLEISRTQVQALVNDPAYAGSRSDLEQLLTRINDQIADIGTEAGRTVARIKDGVESGLADSFESIINGSRNAAQAFADFGNTVLRVLQRIVAESVANRLIGALVGSFAPEASPRGSAQAVVNNPGQFGPPLSRAAGGYVSGPGSGTSDSIPAMLSNGEYVVKAASVRRFGLDFLDRINTGSLFPAPRSMARFAGGGLVGAAAGVAAAATPAPVVNIYGAPAESRVETRRENGRDIVNVFLREVAGDIRAGGPVAAAMASTFGASRQPRRA